MTDDIETIRANLRPHGADCSVGSALAALDAAKKGV